MQEVVIGRLDINFSETKVVARGIGKRFVQGFWQRLGCNFGLVAWIFYSVLLE